MASAIVRSGLRSALRGGARSNPASKRSFSSGASADEEAREAAKWEKITYVGIAACSILAVVNLSKGHPHFDEPPLKKQTTVQATGVASNLVEIIQTSGFKLQALNLSFEDEDAN